VERGDQRVMLAREASQWVPISSQQLYQHVAGVARALRQWGLTKGDRLAILSENRPEWAVADFAALQLGAVVVPIYATLTSQQTAYILADSGAKIVSSPPRSNWKNYFPSRIRRLWNECW